MKKKILFFSSEPGGAEILIPVIELLKAKGKYDVKVTGYGFGLERFKMKQVPCQKIDAIEKGDLKLIKKISPNFIISSAASLPYKDMSEKYLWHNAKKAEVKTMALIMLKL